MTKYWLHSLAIVTLLLVAGPSQYLSGQATAQRTDREGAAPNVQKESVDSSLVLAKTKAYKFRSADFPGAFWSYVTDYNGKIAVGNYYETTSSDISAFFLKSNVYKAIKPASSATSSWAEGVNKSGEIVGAYRDALNTLHGFIFDGTNVTTFDYPGATGTGMFDINDAGDLAGVFSQGGNFQGFLYSKSKNTWTPINYPSAAETDAYGVNSLDVVVGSYFDTGGNSHGFVWNNGVFTGLDYPGASSTYIWGVNDSGLIAGSYIVGGYSHGLLFDGKTYTTVDVPEGKATTLWKVKNNNNVVGNVADAFSNYHGVIGH